MSESNKFTVSNAWERTQLIRNKNIKLSPKYCPRCNTKTVDRPNRRCTNCKGALLFGNYDNGKQFDLENDWYYVWTKSTVTGIEGWFPKEYFEEVGIEI
jgi:hypothetical protein